MKRAIREHWKDFAAILGLLVITIGVAGYILTNERLRFPFISPSPYTINAAFSTAQAVTPGQGQTRADLGRAGRPRRQRRRSRTARGSCSWTSTRSTST